MTNYFQKKQYEQPKSVVLHFRQIQKEMMLLLIKETLHKNLTVRADKMKCKSAQTIR